MTLGANCASVRMTLPPTPDGSQKAVAHVTRLCARRELAAQGEVADAEPTPARTEQVHCRQHFRAYGAPSLLADLLPQSDVAVDS